jgi:hypothetical protein
MREQNDERERASMTKLTAVMFARINAGQDAYDAGREPVPPTIDVLIISGGGDWGAFGAGYLKGWGKIPRSDPMARPNFDMVTGVSTGALIAPFAYIGNEPAIDRVVHLYRNPQPDWVKKRFMFFLPSNISFTEIPGLERELREHVTLEMVKQLATIGGSGRVLAVNTTNVDDGSPHVFDLVAEAREACKTGNLARIHDVMLASAGIPGAFPFRIIDGQMYVDGAVTGNIIYGGRVGEEESIPAAWQKMYPGKPMPKLRYWVIFNNQLRPTPQTTEPRWPAVFTRSMEMSTRAATLTAMRHLFAMAEISHLKRNANIEVRVVSIPGDWTMPVPGVFMKETMNNLVDIGEQMGADSSSWRTTPP